MVAITRRVFSGLVHFPTNPTTSCKKTIILMNYKKNKRSAWNLVLLLNENKFIILEPPVAAHRGHPQGPLLPNWPPRRPKAPPPGPAGAASGGQNHWLFFNIAHAATKETEAQGPSPAPFETAALGDGVACAPGVDGAGMGGKKEFLHLGPYHAYRRRILTRYGVSTHLWLNVTNSLSVGKWNIH